VEGKVNKAKVGYYRLYVLFTIWFLYVVNYFDKFAVLYLLPYIRDELHLSHEVIGLAASLFFFAYWMAQLPSGMLADKFGPKRIMAFAIVVFTFFTFLTGRIHSLMSFALVRLGLGFGEGFHFVPSIRTISDWFPPSEKGRATSFFTTSWTLAPAVAAVIITAIAANWGWRAVFYTLAVPGVVGIFLLWYFVKDRPEQATAEGRMSQAELDYIKSGQTEAATASSPGEEDGPKMTFKDTLADMQTWVMGILIFMRLFVFWGTSFWLSSFLAEQHGFKMTTMGALAGFPYLVGCFSQVVSGWLMDKVTKSKTKPIIAAGFAGLAIVLYAITLIPQGNVPLLLLALGVLGFFNSFYDSPMYVFIQMRYPKNVVGSVTGMTALVGQFGSFVAPAVTGFFVTVGASGSVDFSKLFMLFSAVAGIGLLASAILNESPLKLKKKTVSHQIAG
jgi:sugar phosphate permease